MLLCTGSACHAVRWTQRASRVSESRDGSLLHPPKNVVLTSYGGLASTLTRRHNFMSKRGCIVRLSGLAWIGAACGTSLLHRRVLAGAVHGPATLGEMGLGLVSFVLASVGALLMINGPALFARRRAKRASDVGKKRCRPVARPAEPRPHAADYVDPAHFGSSRFVNVTYLADRARRLRP